MSGREPYRLTDIGLYRAGRGRFASPRWWVGRGLFAVAVGRAFLAAAAADLLTGSIHRLVRMEDGAGSDAGTRRVAVYVHYTVSGRVSAMVLGQLEGLVRQGFTLVFVTMAERVPEADWQAVRAVAALMVQRGNAGLDFGAWQHVAPEVRRRWPGVEELLLANDSVLGPLWPLGPVMAAMRAGGLGLFGLTESLEFAPHLQSYFLLARGAAAVGDVLRFVEAVRISRSKLFVVRRCEVGLSRWMSRRGHRVAALFGYERLRAAALADPAERARLEAFFRISDEAAVRALDWWPVNPTLRFWRLLVVGFGFPFLKASLVRTAAGEDWRAAVPADAPCPADMIEAHLAAASGGQGGAEAVEDG